MARCETVKIRRRSVCIGDMVHRITLQGRALTATSAGGVVEFDEGEVVWAAINTLPPGTVIFDGVNDRGASHDFYIRYMPGVTAETWILYDEGDGVSRFDILYVENLDARAEFMRLRANKRGLASKEVNVS